MWHDTLTSLSFDRYAPNIPWSLSPQTWVLISCKISHDQYSLLSDTGFSER